MSSWEAVLRRLIDQPIASHGVEGGICSDKALHQQEDGDKPGALLQSLDTNLDDKEELANRASMLQMYLGLGIVLGDAHLTHFTDEEFC